MFHTKHYLSFVKRGKFVQEGVEHDFFYEKFKSYAVYSESFAPSRPLSVIFWEACAHCMVVVLVSGLIGAFSGGRLLGHLRCFLKKETVNRRG